jgi:hypothetical protein
VFGPVNEINELDPAVRLCSTSSACDTASQVPISQMQKEHAQLHVHMCICCLTRALFRGAYALLEE